MIISNASTDVTTYFVLRDSTNHAPKTDVTVADIDLYYVEQGAAISAKADATALDAADSAHADNKAFHVGQGLYRIDWPDAAFDGGVGKRVILMVVCSGVDTTFLEVELSPGVNAAAISGDATAADNLESACDNYSSTRGLAGTALPDAAADAAGGLPISDAGGLDLDAQIGTDIDAILVDTGTTLDGKLDTIDGIVDDILTDTGTTLDTLIKDVPTVAEFEARTLVAASYATFGALETIDNEIAVIDGIVDSILEDTGTTLPATLATIDGIVDDILADTAAMPTAGGIADAVWDEAIADHAGVGSTGAALAAAGGSGDPWATALPGAYGAGTAGKILGDNLNATVGSRSTLDEAGVRTAVGLSSANLDTQLAALPTDADVETAAGAALTDYDPPTKAELDAGLAGLNDVSSADVQAAAAAALNAYDPPTNAEMEARTLAAASYATAAAQTTIEGKIDVVDATVDDIVVVGGAILEDTGTTIPAQISGLNDLSAADVNAEVVDALNVDTYAEPGQGAPPAAASIAYKVGFVYKDRRNKSLVDAHGIDLYDDAGTTVDQTRPLSFEDGVLTHGKVISGA